MSFIPDKPDIPNVWSPQPYVWASGGIGYGADAIFYVTEDSGTYAVDVLKGNFELCYDKMDTDTGVLKEAFFAYAILQSAGSVYIGYVDSAEWTTDGDGDNVINLEIFSFSSGDVGTIAWKADGAEFTPVAP